jgi:16S rRNA processing protein RimM
MSASIQGEEFITVARVVKPQGRVGEVSAELFTDFPERFAERRRVFAWGADGGRRELLLENFWPHKGRIILKFAGVDDIDAARQLSGAEIQIPRAERTELEAGSFYISDLTGCRVFVEELASDETGTAGKRWRSLGQVTNVIFRAGEAPLLEIREGAKEYLVPFVAGYTRAVDLEAKRIELALPEGMLELDAPLGRRAREAGRSNAPDEHRNEPGSLRIPDAK